MTKFLVNELTRMNSEASSLTAENFEDIVHQSPDNPTTWTNEKHNLYLDHLEVSFVKQLQQSMGLLASCSEQNKNEKHLSGKQHDCVYNSSDQLTDLQDGCWQKINYGRGQPFLHTSVDTLDALKSSQVQRFGRSRPPASAASQQNLVLCSTEKYIAMEGIGSQGLKTRSHQLPAECTGQNFVNGDGQNNSNNESRGQKVEKTALEDNSNHDQIVPSWKCPTSDNSAIDLRRTRTS